MKTYDKFNSRLGENYWQSFVQKDFYFYEKIGKLLKKYLGSKIDTICLDVGSGPGIGAWLCNINKINVKIYGIEPSDNYKAGELLSENLRKSKSPVEYVSFKGEMKDAKLKFKEGKFDFIFFLRAGHEIMLSYKNYLEFVQDFKSCLKLLKNRGMVIIADPKYSDYINQNPEKYEKEVSEIRKYKQETLGHSHLPSDYITMDKLKILFEGFEEKEKIIIPNQKDLEFLKSKGFDLKDSPTEFFIACYQKL